MARPCLLPLVSASAGCRDPARLYFNLRRTFQPSYLLESAEGPGELTRYSVIGCNPLLYARIRGDERDFYGRPDLVEKARDISAKSRSRDALEALKATMQLGKVSVPKVPSRYMLGAIGYVSYDYVRSLIDVGDHAADDLAQPELEFMLPERMVIIDHVARRTHYCSLMLLLDDSDVDEAHVRAETNLKELKNLREVNPWAGQPARHVSSRSNVAKGEFERQVRRVKQYIRAGDVIQAVLSRRIELTPCPPLEQFFLNLKKVNPSPYMFFLDFPDRSIVGSSPELLVKVSGSAVTTRPIAGTRRRGRNRADARAMERELRADEKERAEHVMLVDLGRNDLGRVSEFGSVRVTDFMDVEKYSHVQHLVSNVVGRLQPGRDAFDALRATFPAGTVTGAPKVRAMEIIDELEPTRRGVYAGAIGSFSYGGDADLAITIRTLVAERGRGYVQVGAGIVADSVPSREHYETANKAQALLCAAGV